MSIVEEAFDTDLPVPPGPTPLWRPGGEWSDVCGFLKPPGSEREWQVRVRLYHPRQHAGSQGKRITVATVAMLGWLTVRHGMTDLEN